MVANVAFSAEPINLVSKTDIKNDVNNSKNDVKNLQINTQIMKENAQIKNGDNNKNVEVKNNNLANNANILFKDNSGKYYHIVQYGENVYRISLKYGVKQQELLDANELKDSNVRAGQKLLLPNNAKIEINKDDAMKTDNTQNVPQTNENLNKIANSNNIQKQTLINKIDSTTFIWPSRGTIFGKFGSPTNTGGKSEGVTIGGEIGSVVRATASGVVVYNDKVAGYNNVILIQHYNGFISAYAFIEPLVSVGDRIKKGQVIAHMTRNKQSKRSEMYFSIRKGSKSYDPEKLIQTKVSN